MKIYLHTHILPRNWPDLDAKYGYSGFVRLDHYQPCCARMMIGDRVFREITDNVWDPARRIGECDRDRVSMQVLSTLPVLLVIIRNDSQAWRQSQCRIRIWLQANWNDASVSWACAAQRSARTWIQTRIPGESIRLISTMPRFSLSGAPPSDSTQQFLFIPGTC